MEYLVSRGHRLKDVLEVYTLPQIQVFVEAADIRAQEDHISLATAHRAALQSDKGWRKYMQEVKVALMERETLKSPKPVTPARIASLQLLLGGKWKHVGGRK